MQLLHDVAQQLLECSRMWYDVYLKDGLVAGKNSKSGCVTDHHSPHRAWGTLSAIKLYRCVVYFVYEPKILVWLDCAP